MRKFAILAGAAIVALGTTTSANAWHYGHRHSSGWNNGGALVAGLVGGAVLGTLFSAATSPAWGGGYGYGYGGAYPATYAYGAPQAYYAAPARTRVVYSAAPSYAYYPQSYPAYSYAAPVRTQVVYRSAPRVRYVYAQPRVRVVSQQRVRRGDVVTVSNREARMQQRMMRRQIQY